LLARSFSLCTHSRVHTQPRTRPSSNSRATTEFAFRGCQNLPSNRGCKKIRAVPARRER
jgi:hypothetical protein